MKVYLKPVNIIQQLYYKLSRGVLYSSHQHEPLIISQLSFRNYHIPVITERTAHYIASMAVFSTHLLPLKFFITAFIHWCKS